ncbi:HET-domain-containing protein [Xylariaceae sp. FL1272]|nr:HET-domain-containing protein [Xylariaceae sp. FL1272]
MGQGTLSDPIIIDWLSKRRETLQYLKGAGFNDLQRWQKERRALPLYTSSSPHSCIHCSEISIAFTTEEITKTPLPYNLSEAAQAARGGCALYMAFLDFVYDRFCANTTAIPGDEGFRFWIECNREVLPHTTTGLRLCVQSPSCECSGDDVMPVWTITGDPAGTNVSTRPYERDYQSSTAVNWGQYCIKYCQENHSDCHVPLSETDKRKEIINPASIPSRLLKLYRDENGVISAQTIGRDTEHEISSLQVSSRGFAVLSYCWGGSQSIHLTRGRVGQSPVYPITGLPKTLADAVWYTHHLGLQYLWIDSLCILQDDSDDKGREIPRMGQYYGDATVTICAASADTAFSGFLSMPLSPEDGADYLIGPIQLRAKTTTGEIGTIQAFREPDYFSSQRSREAIVRRGWTLQESLLSRRLLIFSSQHLFFSCRTANASCGGTEPIPNSRMLGTFQSRVSGVSTMSGLLRLYPIVKTWDKVVEEYTQRLLGFPGDKLPAISAMAANLVQMARDERGVDFKYHAGLMIGIEGKDSSWKGELLWAATEPAAPVGIIDGAFAPSWSWASVQSPVHRWESTARDSSDEDGVYLLELITPLHDERNPFGAVKGGTLKVMARTRFLSTIDREEANMVVTRTKHITDEMLGGTGRFGLIVRPDMTDVEDMVAHGAFNIILLQLISPRDNGNLAPDLSAGLLITRCNDQEGQECYRRVGIFKFEYRRYIHRSDEILEQSQKQLALRKSRELFAYCELREVCIL